MARATPHTSTNKGRKVKLVLRDGTSVSGRFIERTAKFVVLECGRFTCKQIDKFIVIKTNAQIAEGPKE